MSEQEAIFAGLNREIFDTKNKEKHSYDSGEGLTKEVVKEISRIKDEPGWMRKFRLRALEIFYELPMPNWGPDLSKLDLNKIRYFIRPDAKENVKDWNELPADIRATFEKLGIPEAERTALAGAGAQYECLSEDSLVFTNPKGPVKIKDIKIGDHVFALDEKTKEIKKAKVLGVKCSGIKKVFEVKAGTRTVNASDNHPFLTLVHAKKPGKRRGRYHTEWKHLKDLKMGDLIAVAKDLPDFGREQIFTRPEIKTTAMEKNQYNVEYTIDFSSSYNNVVLPAKSTEDFMWFLGMFLGDGYIKKERGKEKARVNIATPEEQSQLRKELVENVKKVFDFKVNSLYKYYVSINSTIIARFLEHIGFSGNAHTKDIPEWVFTLPKTQKLAFLGGYLDSDGYVKANEKGVSFTSTNKRILEKIKLLAFYCGLNPSSIIKFSSKHPFDKNRRIEAYRLGLSGQVSLLKSKYAFKKNRLKDGYLNRFTSAKNSDIRKHCSECLGFTPIEEIREIGDQFTYDIEVDGFHNFVAEGFIVHNSAAVYHNLKKQWEDKGVIFTDCDIAIKEHPKVFKEHFMTTCVPVGLHKFSALHAAVWSGGSFIHVPEGVKVDLPLQAYFRMNAVKAGQFEHTLIIAEPNSQLFYIEGCSAPQYTESSIHAGCVELHVKDGARMRYSSVENWSKNTFNLNTKRAIVGKNGVVEWIGGNMGSGVTMLYPCSILRGDNSRADHLAVAFAGHGQNQDTGAKVYHIGKNTTSLMTSKSISQDGGIASYRGLLHIAKGAKGAKSSVECDALMMDEKSKTNTYPYMKINESEVDIGHEATVGKISSDHIFYLMSRGISEEQAKQMIVSGFIEPIVKVLPLEYAVELNRLIQLEMEGSIG